MLAPTQPGLLDFIQFLETKRPTDRYEYTDADRCLAAQYFESRKLPYRYNGFVLRPGATVLEKIEHVAIKLPWTYGAALERARAMYEREG